MKISALETIRCDSFPNILWLQVHTDEGLIGLGEVHFGPGPIESHIHDWAAQKLIGRDPTQVEAAQDALAFYLGFAGSGAEMRAHSALDIALWDLWGQASGQSLTELLGGAVRESIPVYNTCAGSDYVRETTGIRPSSFGRNSGKRFDDIDAFLTRADELAHELLEMGITAMKIWPFDFAAEAHGGMAISTAEINTALEPFEKVRKALGDRMALKAELHGLWHLPAARRIAEALEPFALDWIEDPVRMDHMGTLAAFSATTTTPVAGGETLGGLAAFRDLIEREAVSVPIMDIGWGGGIGVARAVAALADAFRLPMAFHDCSGPVALAVCAHMAMHCRNVAEQEITRAFYYGWYEEMVTDLPPLENGRLSAPDGPGHGLVLRPDFLARDDVHSRRSDGT